MSSSTWDCHCFPPVLQPQLGQSSGCHMTERDSYSTSPTTQHTSVSVHACQPDKRQKQSPFSLLSVIHLNTSTHSTPLHVSCSHFLSLSSWDTHTHCRSCISEPACSNSILWWIVCHSVLCFTFLLTLVCLFQELPAALCLVQARGKLYWSR